MQIITRFKGNYPFGLPNQHTTYVQVLKANLCQTQIHTYQLKSVLLKEISSVHLIKLVKIYREDNNLMLLYQYHKTSLASYVSALSIKITMTPNKYRELIRCFRNDINSIVQILVHFQIKVDLLIENLAVAETEDTYFALKLFVQPDAEFMALRLPMKHHDQIRTRINENRTGLLDFYSLEKKRLNFQFEEMLEATFGKLAQTDRKNANFIINGSKLVFIHSQGGIKKAPMNKKGSVSVEKMQLIIDHREGNKMNQINFSNNERKVIKDKYQNKIKQIQDNLKEIEAHKQSKHSFNPRPLKAQGSRCNQTLEDGDSNNEDLCEKDRKNRLNHSQQKKQKKIKNKEFSDISGTYEKTADSFHRADPKPQKYKMKIITSHDIEVEKIENTKQPQVSGLQLQHTRKILSKLRDSGETPPLFSPAIRHLYNEVQNQQQDDSILHSRKSDLGPTTSRHFDVSGPLSAGNDTLKHQQNNSNILNQNHIQAFQQQNCIYRPMKMRKSQQFCDKFRQVKSKAEQLLRQFALCRKQ